MELDVYKKSLRLWEDEMYGRKLRQVIDTLGLSYQDAANLIGVPKSTISYWVHSEHPPLSGLMKLLEKMKIDPGVFFSTGSIPEIFTSREVEIIRLYRKFDQPAQDAIRKLLENVR